MTSLLYTSPDNYIFQTYYTPPQNTTLVFVGHHGAGSSSQSFKLLQESLTSSDSIATPGFFTFDIRGHANTNKLNESSSTNTNYNLSITQLISDFNLIITQFLKSNPESSIFLIGHSLGGSVLTKYLTQYENDNVKGLIVVDIVEELAISSLPIMESYIRRLPKSFPTIDSVIDYYVDNNQISNRKSLELSVPSLLKQTKDGRYEFVIDLSRTKPFWNGWFAGLSQEFTDLSNSVAKLLILANNNYLDKELIIGQMQGKFQLIVINNSGHFIHEDIPHNFSEILIDFVERNYFDIFHRSDSNLSANAILLNKLNEKWRSKRV